MIEGGSLIYGVTLIVTKSGTYHAYMFGKQYLPLCVNVGKEIQNLCVSSQFVWMHRIYLIRRGLMLDYHDSGLPGVDEFRA